mmetsp:Transcript_25781/g.48907  ORF Transcript_25781/g.48907 Transcript_25781/m.48907 type:complete len:253 (-) Transcript_25781:457-1215(-)
MELDVLQVNRLALGAPALGLEQHAIVEPQLALGHAAEVGSELERAGDFAAHDGAVGVHQQVDALHHVQKHLVFLVLDAIRPPRHCPGDGHGRTRVVCSLQHVRVGLDELRQNLSLRELRVAEVHHLVQQFVANNEVVPQRLLLQLAEVVREHLDEAVQEGEHSHGVGVGARHRQQVQVAVLHICVRDAVVLPYGRELALRFCFKNVANEGFRARQGNVPTVVARDDWLAFHVKCEHCGHTHCEQQLPREDGY